MRLMFAVLAVIMPFALLAEPESTIVLQDIKGEPGALNVSLRNEAQAAVERGLAWLLAQQAEQGHWSSEDFPALTALPVWALAQAGRSESPEVQKAVKYILTCVHEDGSIYREPKEERKGGGLSTYNTAICMVALHALNDPALRPVVLKAREFVTKSQHLGGDIYRGGMGYDPSTGRPYADLSNSYIGYEAMRLTEDVEDQRAPGQEKVDLDWQAAQEFLATVQNRPDATNQPWASPKEDERGGFIYRPDSSQAGEFTDDDGVVRFRTYGSMTYAGLLSLIYADVNRDDARVRSAFDWTAKHWTVDENPGMGASGLYYFYNVLSKSLAAYGANQITLPDGNKLNWRAELVRKLLSLQKIDPGTGHGYWINEDGRWWEADPVLVTSYTVLALQTVLQGAE